MYVEMLDTDVVLLCGGAAPFASLYRAFKPDYNASYPDGMQNVGCETAAVERRYDTVPTATRPAHSASSQAQADRPDQKVYQA